MANETPVNGNSSRVGGRCLKFPIVLDKSQKENRQYQQLQDSKDLVFNCGECDQEFLDRHHFLKHTSVCNAQRPRLSFSTRAMQPLHSSQIESTLIRGKYTGIKKQNGSSSRTRQTTTKSSKNTDKIVDLDETSDKYIESSAVKARIKRGTNNHKPKPAIDNVLKERDSTCRILKSKVTRSKRPNTKRRKSLVQENTSCYVCGKCFNRVESLVQHLKRHNGIKPHCCEHCDKRFVDKGDLRKHVRIHTGEKPYSCNQCQKAFCTQGNLVKHQRIHANLRNHKCSVCSKGFNAKFDLQKHILVHTGQKPFPCSSCEKRYTTNSDLNVHMRTHTGERPYVCDTCGKSFTTSGDLGKHMRIHTGIKLYSCKKCSATFTTSNNFRRHERRHHD